MTGSPRPDDETERAEKTAPDNSWAAAQILAAALRRDAASAASRIIRSFQLKRSSATGHFLWRVAKTAGASAIVFALAVTVTMLWVLHDIPLNSAILAREKSILLEASDGAALGRVGPLRTSNATREEFPPHLVDAVLAIEDRRFYSHWGIDPIGIIRAARRNIISGGIVEGGSTITQQLVKQQLLTRERTFARKLREAFAAVWLDMRFSKEEILARYLNTVYMGAGAQGIPAAAKLYFNKRSSDLTLPEAALLAGMIKAPSRINPLRNLPAARARAALVLRAMADSGTITPATAEAAIAHPATLSHPATAETHSWFSDWVAQEAREVTGALHGALRVRTTLVPRLQHAAERIIKQMLAESADRHVSEAALVAMRPDGAVVAMVGGRDRHKSQFNRAVQAQRQPGSAFKLFVYMAALRSGFTPEDTVDASPVTLGDWSPENSGGAVYGRMSLADAFAHSINTAAVRLAMNVGNKKVIEAARALGITSPLPDVPSLALGTADVNLLELTAAYAGVLAGKAPVEPFGVTSFKTEQQPRAVSIGVPAARQAPLGKVGDELLDLLQLPVEQGTARAAALDGFAAGKTGTTQDNRDAWFIGFTRELVVGVWVGNDDRSPMEGVTGGELPAEVWHAFVTEAAEPQGPAEVVADPSMAAQCDYRACADTYQSFDAADCTYQPFGGGPRTRCEKGSAPLPPAVTDAQETASTPSRCDRSACARAYRSFRPADCTYQPFDGGARRACAKGAAGSGESPEPPGREEEDAGYTALRDDFFAEPID